MNQSEREQYDTPEIVVVELQPEKGFADSPPANAEGWGSNGGSW